MTDRANPASFKRLVAAITQEPDDPTFSVLKAHLLLEELLRAFLDRELSNPTALEGARLSFAQLLAVVRAFDSGSRDEWFWEAISRLNALRNKMAHNLMPKERDELVSEFVSFVVKHYGPMPKPAIPDGEKKPNDGQQYFLPIDMATGALFSYSAGRLGFNMDFE